MRQTVKETKSNIREHREELNSLSHSVKRLNEFDASHRYEMQDHINSTDQKIMTAQVNLESLQGKRFILFCWGHINIPETQLLKYGTRC